MNADTLVQAVQEVNALLAHLPNGWDIAIEYDGERSMGGDLFMRYLGQDRETQNILHVGLHQEVLRWETMIPESLRMYEADATRRPHGNIGTHRPDKARAARDLHRRILAPAYTYVQKLQGLKARADHEEAIRWGLLNWFASLLGAPIPLAPRVPSEQARVTRTIPEGRGLIAVRLPPPGYPRKDSPPEVEITISGLNRGTAGYLVKRLRQELWDDFEAPF